MDEMSQSQPQQTPSQADVKPFTIRHYVLACRERNIYESWPFDEKHLQLCLKHGIKDVLPPLVHSLVHANSDLVHSQSHSISEELGNLCKPHSLIDDLTQNQISIRNECDESKPAHKATNHNIPSSHDEEGNLLHSPNLSQSADLVVSTLNPTSSTNTSSSLLPPTSEEVKLVKHKRRRGRRKNKKRSMADILAVARHCSVEEIHRINKFCYADDLPVLNGCTQQNLPSQKFSKAETYAGDEDSWKKGASGDDTSVNNVAAKGPLRLQFKLNPCNVN